MPTFSTSTPIDLVVSFQVGSIEVHASDREDTVVTVSPSNPDSDKDRRGAEATAVDFDGQRLGITGPKPRLNWLGPNESVDIRIELPTGSRFTANAAVGTIRTTGELGATRVKNSMGDVDVDASTDLWIRTSHGSARAGTVAGGAEVTADMGQVRLGRVSGDVAVKASHGGVSVGECGGDVQARLSYGDFELAKALGSVTAKTAYGRIELGEVSAGSIDLDTSMGNISVGVRLGVASWLDLSSKSGRVRNLLEGGASPAASNEQSVSVRARTNMGEILVQRAGQ